MPIKNKDKNIKISLHIKKIKEKLIPIDLKMRIANGLKNKYLIIKMNFSKNS